jgi:hypothetical protein
LRLFMAQPHCKNFCERVFFCDQRPAHSLSHTATLFVYKKCLTTFCLLFTKSLASKFEARSYFESARASSVRLANQGQPVAPGAGKERLAMAVQEPQGASVPTQSQRSLKIQPVGDFWRKKIKPQILLSGIWLDRAGFKVGHRVQVIIDRPGKITLHFVEQVQEAAL